MRKLAIGALSICMGLLAACSNSKAKPDINFQDTGSADGGTTCNVLTQTGCDPGQKCTWFIDQDGSNGAPDIGHIGCAANGTVALGGACMVGTGGSNATGDDNCETGDVCEGGICKQICSATGSPACDASHACQTYYGFLGPPNMEAGGVCDPICDPLTDNDFLDGSGVSPTKSGKICAATEGCYPGFSGGSGAPTSWTCAGASNTTLVHRSACTAPLCSPGAGMGAYKNGCAQGYIPYVKDDSAGANDYVCIAVCKPADCFMGTGNCGTGATEVQQIGSTAVPTQRCNATDARGNFSATDYCQYSWFNEVDQTNGDVLKSDTSDTVGLCIDSSTLHFVDASGNPTATSWPKCDTLAATGTGGFGADGCDGTLANMAMCSAVDFGCMSTGTGGVTEEFNKAKTFKSVGPHLRHLYSNSALQVRN